MVTKNKEEIRTNFLGSIKTAESVRKQILERWGKEASEEYDPFTNCMSFNCWKNFGYIVNKGERALKSVVLIEKKNSKGKVIDTYCKPVNLFFKLQVHKVE